MDSGSQIAAILSLAGVVITGLLTTLTAIRSGKDRRERNADRRKIEEETTDVILKRVRRELDAAYLSIDIKDRALRQYARFFRLNRERLELAGFTVPEIELDEGPVLSEQQQEVRVEIDRAAEDERESDKLLDEDRRG